jgi:hypothetical protein
MILIWLFHSWKVDYDSFRLVSPFFIISMNFIFLYLRNTWNFVIVMSISHYNVQTSCPEPWSNGMCIGNYNYFQSVDFD